MILKVMLSARAAKAYVAAAVAGMSAAVPLVDDGLTVGETLGVLVAALVGFQGVFWTTNHKTTEGS